ncbi:unnamed protein product [Chrysodeixis includens]|uniref:Uncharacterized protein n=1 Tax=Chrysodeixis includens TaxID=689277 RepID=A0A9N8KVX6_CHRIL|nr:unnamed protein product [Chrysodeixis includens]
MTRVLLVCVALLAARGVIADVWEFGYDAPGSIIVDHREGEFSIFQKTKHIKLKVSFRCEVIRTHAIVEVHNSISSPNVTYNKVTNVVTMAYKPLQISTSNYNVIAKAARKPGCYNQNMEAQQRSHFG